MKNFNKIIASLAIRLLIAAPVFAYGWHLIAAAKSGWSNTPQIFFAMACFVACAFIVAPAVARLISEPTGALYYSDKKYILPPPLYDVAESLREQGRYAEAMTEYEKIAEQYPDETKPFVEMIDMAVEGFKDRELAKAIYKRGLSLFEDDKDLDILKIAYTTATSEFSIRQK